MEGGREEGWREGVKEGGRDDLYIFILVGMFN